MSQGMVVSVLLVIGVLVLLLVGAVLFCLQVALKLNDQARLLVKVTLDQEDRIMALERAHPSSPEHPYVAKLRGAGLLRDVSEPPKES